SGGARGGGGTAGPPTTAPSTAAPTSVCVLAPTLPTPGIGNTQVVPGRNVDANPATRSSDGQHRGTSHLGSSATGRATSARHTGARLVFSLPLGFARIWSHQTRVNDGAQSDAQER